MLTGSLLAFSYTLNNLHATDVFNAGNSKMTVIIDPGRGGEDGGAVASDGTVESNLNLAASLKLREIFRFCGMEPIMTRETDISIYSDGASTLREKKISDLKNRVALVNETENAVLISIHQNSLPTAPSACGAQVFYNRADGAEDFAVFVQSQLNSLNGEKKKTEKQISSDIYLMKNVTAPSILIECGFMSNQSDLQLLKTDTHQIHLALAIASGYYERLNKE